MNISVGSSCIAIEVDPLDKSWWIYETGFACVPNNYAECSQLDIECIVGKHNNKIWWWLYVCVWE